MVDVNKISKLKEFYNLRESKPNIKPPSFAFNDLTFLKETDAAMLSLQGHQIFIKNIFDPHTVYKRLLLYHGTGTGKTLIILSIAEMYIKYYKNIQHQPTFTIIGFTEDIIIRELLKHVDFGYVTLSEKENLDKLRFSTNERDIMYRRGLKSMIKRRITDKNRGGYYKFFGYQKFANDLFVITPNGIANKITHAYLYEDADQFEKRVDNEIEKKNIKVNRALIESLKYGFIACDEIHNTYNAKSKNNRGMALDYALRLLETEDPISAPKVIFASATPLTGNVGEIVDLMNLLIPNQSFNKNDFFTNKNDFKPDALEKIGKICNGYVSFLKDYNIEQYPQRIIEGKSMFNIAYLKFISCIMSNYQTETLAMVKDKTKDIESLLSTNAYTLYDIAFPNPNNTKYGLYDSSKIYSIIENASPEWQQKIGIETHNNIITGDFLKEKNIGKYSEKYKILLEEINTILSNKTVGKMIIYHYYVSTGVIILRELFIRNGYLDATSAPLSNTKCSICGIEQQHHKGQDHTYKPVRILIAYGEISSELDKTLALFNDVNNIYGHQYRILIGSRVIHEGIDFNSVRFLFVLSLPRDISTLIQLFGRAIRKGSHLLLEQEYRNVFIYILVSTFTEKDKISPELLNYKRKMNVYLQIQLVERELRRYAIDNFINYDKLNISDQATLDGLPYKPVFKFEKIKSIPSSEVSTYSAYGYSIIEEDIITTLLKKLFVISAVWTEEDLWNTILHPFADIQTPYDHSTFTKENFLLALDFLVNSTYIENLETFRLNNETYTPYINLGGEARRVSKQGEYYILCPTDNLGIPIIDYDSFMRMDISEVEDSISIADYVEQTVNETTFKIYLNEYKKDYSNDPLLSLVKLHPHFHYTVIRQIIEGYNISGIESLLDIYEELGLFIYYNSFLNTDIANTYGKMSKTQPVGFRAQDISFLFINKTWQKIPTTLLISHRYTEQKWIGFSKITIGNMEFKIRPGIEYLDLDADKRKINRGRVCSTLSSYTIKNISNFLKVSTIRVKLACNTILKKMLDLQQTQIIKGGGIRYYYFFWESMPIL